MSLETPSLSVLIPVFNAEPFLRRCLNSVKKQTLKDLEIICINDGSTDGSLKILQEYAKNDPRFQILDKPNSGYGDSLNQALDRATGDYIAIVEPDDYLELDMFAYLIQKARETDADIAKASFFNYYGRTGKNIPEILFPPKFFTKNHYLPDDYLLNPRENPAIFLTSPTIWSAIYRRDMLEKKHIRFLPTPGASYQDIGFAFKTFAAAEKVYFTNHPLYHYRRDNATSSVKSTAKVLAVKKEFDVIDDFLDPSRYIILDAPSRLDFQNPANLCRFRSYLWNYNRLKLKPALEFAKVAKKDYRKAYQNGFCISSFTGLERAGESKLATKYPSLYVFLRPLFRFKNSSQTALLGLFHKPVSKDMTDTFGLICDGPHVTFVVAAYNIEKHIRTCLDSIFAQKMRSRIDVIIVDDGSTDNTGKICDEYAYQFSTKIIHQENAGLSAARNAGLKAATSEFVAFVDGDDRLEPHFAQKLLDAFDGDTDIVTCGYFENGAKILPEAPEKLSGEGAAAKLLVEQENLDLVAWNKLYRVSLFRENNIEYPVGMKHEDSLTTYKLYAAAAHVRYLDAPLYHYRHRKDSIMSTQSLENSLKIREQAAREAIEYFAIDSNLKAAAEISLLTAKFAYLDAALRGEINEKYAITTLAWLKNHVKSYQKNPHLTKRLRLYLKLIKTPGSSAYKLFRKLV